jgi:hypothetical protein
MSGNGLTYSEFKSDGSVLPTTNITALSGNNATSSDAPVDTSNPENVPSSTMTGGRRRRKRKGGSKKEEPMNMLMFQGGTDYDETNNDETNNDEKNNDEKLKEALQSVSAKTGGKKSRKMKKGGKKSRTMKRNSRRIKRRMKSRW